MVIVALAGRLAKLILQAFGAKHQLPLPRPVPNHCNRFSDENTVQGVLVIKAPTCASGF